MPDRQSTKIGPTKRNPEPAVASGETPLDLYRSAGAVPVGTVGPVLRMSPRYFSTLRPRPKMLVTTVGAGRASSPSPITARAARAGKRRPAGLVHTAVYTNARSRRLSWGPCPLA